MNEQLDPSRNILSWNIAVSINDLVAQYPGIICSLALGNSLANWREGRPPLSPAQICQFARASCLIAGVRNTCASRSCRSCAAIAWRLELRGALPVGSASAVLSLSGTVC